MTRLIDIAAQYPMEVIRRRHRKPEVADILFDTIPVAISEGSAAECPLVARTEATGVHANGSREYRFVNGKVHVRRPNRALATPDDLARYYATVPAIPTNDDLGFHRNYRFRTGRWRDLDNPINLAEISPEYDTRADALSDIRQILRDGREDLEASLQAAANNLAIIDGQLHEAYEPTWVISFDTYAKFHINFYLDMAPRERTHAGPTLRFRLDQGDLAASVATRLRERYELESDHTPEMYLKHIREELNLSIDAPDLLQFNEDQSFVREVLGPGMSRCQFSGFAELPSAVISGWLALARLREDLHQGIPVTGDEVTAAARSLRRSLIAIPGESPARKTESFTELARFTRHYVSMWEERRTCLAALADEPALADFCP